MTVRLYPNHFSTPTTFLRDGREFYARVGGLIVTNMVTHKSKAWQARNGRCECGACRRRAA